MLVTTTQRIARLRLAGTTAMLLAAVFVGGCSGTEIAGPAPRASLGCVDDSPQCIAERGNLLKGMMADKSKSWVRAPAGPGAYAAGVRLWAFKTKKRELTCDELSYARREADGAAPSLRSANGSLTPAQISRGIMLAQDVSKELNNEFGRRCKA
jgi:hypothetical protein